MGGYGGLEGAEDSKTEVQLAAVRNRMHDGNILMFEELLLRLYPELFPLWLWPTKP